MGKQHGLFEEAEPLVPGLSLWPDAVTEEQEADLAAHVDAAPLEPFRFGQWQGKRLTANYGSGYDYQRGAVTNAPAFPAWLAELRDQLAPIAGITPSAAVQALLIRYDPGAGIGWHRDRPQYGDVLGLSLSAPALLRLRRRTGTGFERRSVELPGVHSTGYPAMCAGHGNIRSPRWTSPADPSPCGLWRALADPADAQTGLPAIAQDVTAERGGRNFNF